MWNVFVITLDQLLHARIQGTAIATVCPVAFCQFQHNNASELITHIKSYIADGIEIACPFKDCDLHFKVESTFRSHLHRKHRKWTATHLKEQCIPTPDHIPAQEDVCIGESDTFQCPNNAGAQDDIDDHESCSAEEFTRNLFLFFYLHLQAKFLLAASTVQSIVNKILSISDLNLTYITAHLQNAFDAAGLELDPQVLSGVISELREWAFVH